MATIIKRGQQTPSPSGGSVHGLAFDLEEMSGHADRYVEDVRREAAKIVQQANAEAADVRRRAEVAGRDTAEQAIEQVLNTKIAQQMETLRPALEGVVAELQQARCAWLDHWQQATIELAAKIAERLIRRELSAAPEITVEWARGALELATGGSEVTVRLSPKDHANLGHQVETIAGSIAKVSGASVVADESVSPGGCVVETRHGAIDAQVESQLARMVQELM